MTSSSVEMTGTVNGEPVVGEVAGRPVVLHYGDPLAEFDALTRRCGVARFPRTQLEFTGPDRASYLHNLCTNEVKKLAAGQGCEAFVTNIQGKTIGHVYIFAGATSHVVDTVPDQAARLRPHFEKYHIQEHLTIRDRSADWSELLLTGDEAESLAQRVAGAAPVRRLEHVETQIAGQAASLRRVDYCGPTTFLISSPTDGSEAVWQALVSAGAAPCGHQAVEMARIEAGTPIFGPDISDKNLPQELARDALAISFTKGCYLGQETVARIDALGHVNQTLRKLRFTGREVPPLGTELHVAHDPQKVVGTVTSAAFCPRLIAPLALAYVRREHHQPGTLLESRCGAAEICA